MRGASTKATTCATVFSKFRLGADQVGLREAVLQVAHQRVRVVAQQDRADALVGRRHQHRAQRTGATAKRIASPPPPRR
jgi:N-acetylglutamate synthase/N-acetylornithine aminotransferase